MLRRAPLRRKPRLFRLFRAPSGGTDTKTAPAPPELEMKHELLLRADAEDVHAEGEDVTADPSPLCSALLGGGPPPVASCGTLSCVSVPIFPPIWTEVKLEVEKTKRSLRKHVDVIPRIANFLLWPKMS